MRSAFIKKSLTVVAALAMVFGSSAVLTACGTAGAVHKVGAKEFSDALVNEKAVLIDVRSPEEFAQGHIAGATNINVEGADFASQIETLDKTKTYAVYCHSGRRSGIATDSMEKAGFAHMYDLSGGIQAWQSAGGEVVTN